MLTDPELVARVIEGVVSNVLSDLVIAALTATGYGLVKLWRAVASRIRMHMQIARLLRDERAVARAYLEQLAERAHAEGDEVAMSLLPTRPRIDA